MRRPQGAAAFLRAVREEIAPIFGAIPWDADLVPWDGVVAERAPVWACHVTWGAWGPAGRPYYHPPYGCWFPLSADALADRPLRHALAARLGWLIWRNYLPAQRRQRRAYAEST